MVSSYIVLLGPPPTAFIQRFSFNLRILFAIKKNKKLIKQTNKQKSLFQLHKVPMQYNVCVITHEVLRKSKVRTHTTHTHLNLAHECVDGGIQVLDLFAHFLFALFEAGHNLVEHADPLLQAAQLHQAIDAVAHTDAHTHKTVNLIKPLFKIPVHR